MLSPSRLYTSIFAEPVAKTFALFSYMSKNPLRNLEFHDFSFSLAPVEADARVFTAPGAVLAPSNRAPKLSLSDCGLASPATGASSPRRTRRLRPKGLSTFRMLAADQDAPLSETRIGLASGLRGDLRPPPERPRTPSGAAGGGAAQKERKKRTAWTRMPPEHIR